MWQHKYVEYEYNEYETDHWFSAVVFIGKHIRRVLTTKDAGNIQHRPDHTNATVFLPQMELKQFIYLF